MKETHRAEARARLADLVARLKGMPATDGLGSLVEEAEALDRAVDAFHMEAIRFRMFNVDRQLHRLPGGAPEDAARLFAEVRESLEAAGFHTRSH
jgi:hypothetical protein